MLRLGLFFLFVGSSFGLYEAEVGVVDWHKRLIGVPVSPSFHRPTGSSALVVTTTQNNVLAAVNPVNGSIAWRHVFQAQDPILAHYNHPNVITALSGPGGSILRAFDPTSGDLLYEKQLHSPSSGLLTEPANIGADVAFVSDSKVLKASPDLVVLTNGHTLNYIKAGTGGVQWTWSSQDQTSLVIYSKIIVEESAIYVVGLAKSLTSFTLHIVSLNPTTGEIIAEKNIVSKVTAGIPDLLTLSSAPIVVWLQSSAIRYLKLSPALTDVKSVSVGKNNYKKLIDVGLSDKGLFVAIGPRGSDEVFQISSDGSSIASIWEFSETVNPIYSGGRDADGRPYVSSAFWSNTMQQFALQVFVPHLVEGRGLLFSSFVPFDTHAHGVVNNVAIDAVNPDGVEVAVRALLTTTTGAVQLWQGRELEWTREESLATIVVSAFVELPERVINSAHPGEQESFTERLMRQLSDAQDFPQYLVNFVRRFATGSYASVSAPAPVSSSNETLSRDAFGLRQVIVAATSYGNVFGIDSSNGNIIWQRIMGLGWAAEVGGTVIPAKMFVTKTVASDGRPEVVLVTQRRADNTLVDTVVFHIDALTGKDARGVEETGPSLEGVDVIAGPLIQTFVHPTEMGSKFVILLDEFLQVYLYPDTPANQRAFQAVSSSLHYPLQAATQGKLRVEGHQMHFNPELSSRYVSHATWTMALPQEEDILTLVQSTPRGPVASLGKVLGNRTTLYKYLNPRLFVVLTVSHSVSPATCGVYVVDSAKGTIVYRASVPASRGGCNVKATLTENWLVYHYYDDGFSAYTTKGNRLVSVELYEGRQIDEKTKSSSLSAYSHLLTELTAIEQSYIFPHAISAITTTSTKFGITGKDLIVATTSGKIQTFPRAFLNPRRPDRKVTTEEQEEMLIKYDPILPDDPRRVISHKYEIANVQEIITSPTLLESTSLVFAHGLDLFLSRVAPSGTFDVLSKNFNKVQLVLTVLGLAAGILVARPIVRRKQQRERWYD